MRFRKGDKVEVMNTKETPVSWRRAKILSGNGHSFRVQYDSYHIMGSEKMVDTISRKSVRPCPPLLQGVENCIIGDIVEVFCEFSWKISVILKIMDGKKENKRNKIYLVRLLGCSREVIVDRSNIRRRQMWRDNEWVMMGKSPRESEEVIASKPSTSNCYQKTSFHVPQLNARATNQLYKDRLNKLDYSTFQEYTVISSRSLKRKSPYGSIIEAHNGRTRKFRAVQKVDAVAYPKDILGEKNMHISNGHNNQTKKAKQNEVLECSVGSCSVTNQCPKGYFSHFKNPSGQETDNLCSDAESSCYGERKSRLNEEIEVSIIRRLELHAYRTTLEALYASGPISWDQQELLTNLRIVLNISNDEHLMELKQLASAKNE